MSKRKVVQILEIVKKVPKKNVEMVNDNLIRCFGKSKLYADYHDNEWGVPVYEDTKLFEMLILEGAQAGLNWETVLKKREGYRAAFHQFDVKKVANMKEEELNRLLVDADIVKNKLKVFSARKNAIAFLKIQEEFGSFSTYLWNFVKNKPIVNRWKNFNELPTSTLESVALSADLKKRGMTFVGPTIMYAFMQAVGLVNDHLVECWKS